MSEVNAFLGGLVTGIFVFTTFVVIRRNMWRLKRRSRVGDEPPTREFSVTTEYILTLIVRADIELHKSNMASYCSRAAVTAFDDLLSKDSPSARFWQYTGQKKVLLAADSVDVINNMDDLARRLGLRTTFVCNDQDNLVGPTEVALLAIGPGPSHLIKRITYNLRLLV